MAKQPHKWADSIRAYRSKNHSRWTATRNADTVKDRKTDDICHSFKVQGKYGEGTGRLELYTNRYGAKELHCAISIDRPFQRSYFRTWRTGFDGVDKAEVMRHYRRLLKRHVGNDERCEG